jgi:diaminohydroxyphosphoribosylaminopyrimidine deaminase/5-amino-6-(5-phosphoribosylamino)uracil reductase
MLEAQGVQILEVAAGNGHVDPAAALAALGEAGVTRLMVEGGAQVSTALLRAGLVDQICWFRAPTLIGGDGLPPFGDLGVSDMSALPAFRTISSTTLGNDILDIFARVP